MTPTAEQLAESAKIVLGWIEDRIGSAQTEPIGLAVEAVFEDAFEGLTEDEQEELTGELEDAIWIQVGRTLIAEHGGE